MADVTFKQALQINTGLASTQSASKISETDLVIDPPESTTITDYNETGKMRFLLPDATVDYPICLGTVALAKVVMIKPYGIGLQVKFTNTEGISQNITFRDNVWSVLHIECSGITLTNTSGANIKGVIFVAGD